MPETNGAENVLREKELYEVDMYYLDNIVTTAELMADSKQNAIMSFSNNVNFKVRKAYTNGRSEETIESAGDTAGN